MKLFYRSLYYSLVVCCLSIGSCTQQEELPFPYDIKGANQLLADTLSSPAWTALNLPDTLGFATKTTAPFQVSTLPVHPFRGIATRTLTDSPKAVRVTHQFRNIDANAWVKDSVDAKVSRFPIPVPQVNRLVSPKLLSGTTTGLLQLSEEEGLPDNFVRSVTADTSGTLWFSTDKGVSKYSGDVLLSYGFTNNTPQGSPYPVNHLTFDHQGRIWLASCGEGFFIVDPSGDSVIHVNDKRCYSSISVDHTGIVWMGGFQNELVRVDPTTLERTIMPISEMMITIVEDSKHRIWLGGRNAVFVLDSTRRQILQLDAQDGMVSRSVTRIFEDQKGGLWINSVMKGLTRVDENISSVSRIDSAMGFSSNVLDMQQDHKGRFWFFANDSAFIYDQEKNKLRVMYTGAKLLTNWKSLSYKDAFGNIWLGTANKGFILMDTDGPMAEHLDLQSGLSNVDIWGMFEDTASGRIWLGSRKGLNIVDKSRQKVSWYVTGDPAKDNVRRFRKLSSSIIAFTTNHGISMIDESKGTITNFGLNGLGRRFAAFEPVRVSDSVIILNTDGGLLQIDLRTGMTLLYGMKQGLPSDLIWDIHRSASGEIWLGTDSGLVQLDESRQRLRTFRKQDGLVSNIVQRIEEETSGELAVAMQGGISIISSDRRFVSNIVIKQGPTQANVYDLVVHDNYYYAGSQDGLYVIRLDKSAPRRYQMTRYGKKQGFPYNDYNQNTGIRTADGQLWFGISPLTTIIPEPLKMDTVPSVVFISGIKIQDAIPDLRNRPSAKETGNGSSLASGEREEQARFKKIQGISWNGKREPYDLPLNLKMAHNVNTVSFNFGTHDIRGRDQVLFSYCLQGEDTAWSEPSPRPVSGTYFNLAPGKYTFRVRMKGFNGLWSEEDSFSFQVLIPWWRSWWALLLFAFSFGLAAWLVAGYRARQLKKENVYLEARVNERTVALENSIVELKNTQAQMIQREKMASLGELTAGIAHEIQNPLNFVNNFSEVNHELLDDLKAEMKQGNTGAVEELINDLRSNNEKISHHGKRADSIIKSMLQHSRSVTGEKELTDINALSDEYLQLSYHGMRAKEKDFNANIVSSFAPDLPQIKVVPQDIGRVLMNLLNNAFYAAKKSSRNGQAGFQPEVSLKTTMVDGKIQIAISDNGDGIPQELMKKIFQPFFTTKPTGEGTGLGLSLSFDIVSKGHGGQLTVNTKQGEGTTFVITLPA